MKLTGLSRVARERDVMNLLNKGLSAYEMRSSSRRGLPTATSWSTKDLVVCKCFEQVLEP